MWHISKALSWMYVLIPWNIVPQSISISVSFVYNFQYFPAKTWNLKGLAKFVKFIVSVGN